MNKIHPSKIFVILLFLQITFLNKSLAQSTTGPVIYNASYVAAQLQNPTDPFDSIVRRARAFFASVPTNTNQSLDHNDEGDQLEEHFERWEEFWRDRSSYPNVRNGGDVNGAKAVMANLALNNQWCLTSPSGCQGWVSEGPAGSALCDIGIISAIASAPTNPLIIYAGSDAGGLFKTIDGGVTWNNLTGFNINNFPSVPVGIGAIEVDPINPLKVMVATNNGLFGGGSGIGILKTTDGGVTWVTSLPAPVGSDAHAVKHGSQPGYWYAGIGTNLYYTYDDGLNWAQSSINPPSLLVHNLLNGNQLIDCPPNPPLDAINEIWDMEQSLTLPSVIFASTRMSIYHEGAKILYSTDNGFTYNQMSLPNFALNPYTTILIDVTPNDPTALYAYYLDVPNAPCNWMNGATYVIAKTTDLGATWTLVDQRLYNYDPYYVGNFEMSNINNDYLISALVTLKGTYVGPGSYTYADVTAYDPSPAPNNTHGDIRAIAAFGNGFIAGCDGGVIKSTSNGDYGSWDCINGSGLNCSKFYAQGTFQKNNNIIAAPQDTWMKIRNSNTWSTSGYSGGEAYWVETVPSDDNLAYESGNQTYIGKSINGALSFQTIANNLTPGWKPGRFHLDPTNPNIIWDCSSTDQKLYKYNSGNWSMVHNPGAGVTPVSAVAVAPSNANIIYEAHENPTYPVGAGSKKLYKSIDGGLNFTDVMVTSLDPVLIGTCTWWSIKHITIDPLNQERVWLAFNSVASPGSARVLFSGNGGINWVDMSNGLTGLCVNHLTYQNGTNDVMYAATDAGVYRYKGNAPFGVWECFNLNLPKVCIRKVEINYCQNKIFCSAYGRGVFSCPLPSPIPSLPPTSPLQDFHITGAPGTTVTIPANFNQTFGNRIVVDPGIFLYINGQINFSTNNSLFIDQNAHVVLSGTLTSNCAAQWRGVYVNGNSFQNQNYANGLANYQGIIEVAGGKISNAITAITNSGADINGNIFPSSTGGVITSFGNALFENNQRDIRLLPYTLSTSYKAVFFNTRFYTTSLLLNGLVPLAHVELNDVQGINFLGCDFANTFNSPGIAGLGIGIKTTDALYSVIDGCTGYNNGQVIPCPTPIIQSKFTNLNRGIQSFNTNPLRTVIVNHAIFTNNYIDGASFGTVNNLKFTNNTIVTGSNLLTQNCGLYLNNCQYYRVENNTFTGPAGPTAVGIYAYQSTTGNHKIYRNIFKNLIIGIAPENDNSGYSNNLDGLFMNCNDFNQGPPNNWDIAMQTGNPNLASTVAKYQGATVPFNSQMLVRNQYGAPCSGNNENKWYIQNVVAPTKLVIHPFNNVNLATSPGLIGPCSDAFVNANGYNFPIDCPNNSPLELLPKKIDEININLGSTYAISNSVINNYTNTIDGGNTQQLLSAISSNISSGNLKNLLEQKSPYLSDAVLSAYFSKLSIPNGHIKDIHDKNKPVSQSVWQILINRNLPNGIMHDLNEQQATSQPSSRSVMESGLSKANADLQSAYFDKLTYFTSDSLPASLDSVISLLKANYPNVSSSTRMLINAYINKGNYAEATRLSDSMMINNPINAGLYSLQKIIIELDKKPKKFFEILEDPLLLTNIKTISNDLSNPGYLMAQAILNLVTDAQYSDVRLLPSFSAGKSYNNQELKADSEKINQNSDSGFKCYPNPTNSELNFIYQDQQNGTADFLILDNIGRQLYNSKIEFNQLKSINAKNFEPGLYLIQVYQNKRLLASQRIMIMN